MKLGIVGLGRMGGGIAARLRDAGHEVAGYDVDASLSDFGSLESLVASLQTPRYVWLMLPAGVTTESAVEVLAAVLSPGDVVVDGGNSHYRDSQRRAVLLTEKRIDYLDCGTSGGVWGKDNGFCLMIGGPKHAFETLEPVFKDLVPPPPGGYEYLGPSGAGHYAKMVHNAIEYGLLQAYAEGFSLLEAGDFDYDLARVSQLWGNGSVVRSWLLELSQRAFEADPKLTTLQGYVEDSGEGRWAVEEAVERGLPLPAITLSLYRRFASRDGNPFANRFIAALRNQFGGHGVRTG